jgi:S-DNA-T family DNA segregation ATPase FtsK/SpoIIIE
MATKAQKKQAEKGYSIANEIAAIVLLAIAVLVFLSLISFNENDYYFINSSTSQIRHNWIGVVGAVTAGVLINDAIGMTAYVIPALLALIAWRFFRSENILPRPSRVIGFLLFIASLSGLFELFGGEGALVGETMRRSFVYLLGKIGAGIVLGGLFLTSSLLITNLSYFSFLSGFKTIFDFLGIGEWAARLRAWREEQNRKAQERMERRREMRVEKEKPTISTGETPVAANGKTSKAAPAVTTAAAAATAATAAETVSPLGAKIGDIFKRAGEKQKEIEHQAEPKIEEKIETAAEDPFEEEEIRPTISTSEESHFATAVEEISPDAETDDLVLPAAADLDEEFAQIPISPMKATGELENVLADEEEKEAAALGAADEEIEEIDAEPLPGEKQPPQNFDNYVLPEPQFLTAAAPHVEQKEEALLAVAQELTEKTKEFNVTGRVMHICQGPVVTTYEFKPDPGVKYSRITSLSDDLCLALKAESIRIDRIPGKAYVGIEVPNHDRETIYLREVIESRKFKDSGSLLTIALGKTIDGLNYVTDLAKMPHLLIAGATGAGKSVGVNTLVVSILYKAKPDEVKFIMVDPKRLELGLYADIPHLATPIITDPKRAAISLKWAVSEMEKRYRDLAGWGVRNIDGYNSEVKKRNAAEHFDDNGEPWKTLPYIVIIIDELADLMMVAGKEVEESITRLAQMARAVGIHLVLATQRPSVDVITGLIKANFPARVSFRVSSKVDSRTIIDSNGAERLLGRGDMLFLPPATSQIVRVHGAFVDEKEIQRIVDHIKAQGRPEYDTTITKTEEELDESADLPGKRDPLFVEALRTVVSAKRASTSLLQRHLRIGYGRAAAILDAMVREGYIGEMDGSTRARPILQKAYEDLQEMEEGREL